MSIPISERVTDSPHPRIVARSRVREAARWFAWSLPALPVAVLLHELGHMAWLKYYQFSDVRLHFAAVSYGLHDRFWEHAQQGDLAGAAKIVPLLQIGIATATGIVISYLTIAGAAFLTNKRPPHPFIVAVGLTAGLRFKIGIEVLQRLLFTRHRMASGTDEGLVSAVSGIREAWLWAIGLLVVLIGWGFIIRGLPKGKRWTHLGLVAAGVAVGAVIYVVWLGPLLLPY